MKRYSKISDEELAAYLEKMMSKQAVPEMDGAMDVDTLEVLNVSRQAMKKIKRNNIFALPRWEDIEVAACNVAMDMCEDFPMAGFLGEESGEEEETEDNSETDN